jgi:hypothetical protein
VTVTTKCRLTALNISNLRKAGSPFIRKKLLLPLAPKTDLPTYSFRVWQATPSSGKSDSYPGHPAQFRVLSPTAREVATI